MFLFLCEVSCVCVCVCVVYVLKFSFLRILTGRFVLENVGKEIHHQTNGTVLRSSFQSEL